MLGTSYLCLKRIRRGGISFKQDVNFTGTLNHYICINLKKKILGRTDLIKCDFQNQLLAN